ncbi:N-acetyltransferase [Sporosarcina sp. PTS2304]|uniref:GNAT family N-acetyltransferase n=1 Tax=Sporosarcina sp. PTS2304 TaxID=2283194 RepID=UPI000E0D251B|nr:GNAT family N-acetyltransferase [Sporosarcina sp. PTS2304]AXH99828.1 N-acetyltransferase [Sporosarcina sp. PTS2304]
MLVSWAGTIPKLCDVQPLLTNTFQEKNEVNLLYFETERLVARQLEQKDFDEFNEMQGNSKVMKYTVGRAKTREENKSEFENIISGYFLSETNRIVMGISRKSDETSSLVGACAVEKLDLECVEVGYRFLEKYWGNGFGLEVLEGLLTYSLLELGAKEVIAEVYKENINSVRVLEKSYMDFIKEYTEEKSIVQVYGLKK